ncbi:Carbonic anhydrase-related protein 10 [Eumeta japonica]|uniref:Carbonic anhydrase-related protein 10 n=1 Tax=Eumeta variegata TaxID=151549 RepID=A0A4C1VVQ6_EUMVA|nr:Carbonic anhydrase-related protein 10 [Eumeta japonica]
MRICILKTSILRIAQNLNRSSRRMAATPQRASPSRAGRPSVRERIRSDLIEERRRLPKLLPELSLTERNQTAYQVPSSHSNSARVSGILHNTGQSLVFRVEKESKHQVNISGGPLSYRYQFEEIYFHYGMEDSRGSEHQIDMHTFPGEHPNGIVKGDASLDGSGDGQPKDDTSTCAVSVLQLYGFNKELYHNMSEAQHKSQGIVAISLMLQIGEPSNQELRLITSAFNKVTYRGSSTPITHLPLSALLPDTQQYLTYEGSTTHPGCWETAVWILYNKPIYISKQEMYALRRLMQGSQLTPKAPLGNNARPAQPLYFRTVRTNINFSKQAQGSSNCPDMYRNMHYTATQWHQREHSMRYRSIDDISNAMMSLN